MTEPTTVTRIELDPDGRPVQLVDVAGHALDGTLWGAARAGGWIALVVGEHDNLSGQPADPPTVGAMLALGDALTDDPENPHTVPGTRQHALEELRARRAELQRLRAARDRDQQALDEMREQQVQAELVIDRLRANLREHADNLPAPPGSAPAAEDEQTHRRRRRIDWLCYGAIVAVGAVVAYVGVIENVAALAAMGGTIVGLGWASLFIPESPHVPTEENR